MTDVERALVSAPAWSPEAGRMLRHHAGACRCVSEHRPAILQADGHHVWPRGMGGPDIEANIVDVCPNTHRNAHEILATFVAAGVELPRVAGQPRYAYDLALLGFRRFRAGRLDVGTSVATLTTGGAIE